MGNFKIGEYVRRKKEYSNEVDSCDIVWKIFDIEDDVIFIEIPCSQQISKIDVAMIYMLEKA